MSARRVERLHMPERAATLGRSVRDADRHVQQGGLDGVEDATHFDTVRFPPPLWAREAMARAIDDGRLAYTPYRGHPEVLAEVAANVGALLGVALDPERELVLTPGTQGGLFATLATLVEPGTRVALFDPDYLFSERQLSFLGAQIDYVPLRREGDRRVPDLDALETALAAGARVVLFSHPNNPTGAVYPPATIARIVELAEAHGAHVVVDALYARLVYDDVELAHPIALPGARERCVTLVGPSKTESLSGFRLGVVVAPADVADRVEDVLSATALRAPAYGQQLLRHWLRDDAEPIARRVGELRALRDTTVARLAAIDGVEVLAGQGTAYAFPDVSALGVPDHVVGRALVRDANLLVSPGYQFGPGGVGSFRVCFARQERAWDAALDRVAAVLRALA